MKTGRILFTKSELEVLSCVLAMTSAAGGFKGDRFFDSAWNKVLMLLARYHELESR